MADVAEITVDEHGDETHPAWVLVGASRVSATPGAVLFDSDIKHGHYIVVRVKRATRKRDLMHDWKHGRETIVEFAMSEAQWASFVSSMNSGDGVPATLEWDATMDDPRVPGVPYEPRLAESMAEVHGATAKGIAEVQEALEAYKEHKTADGLRTLEARINNLPANLRFAGTSLAEHAENVVQRSRADIEAFVLGKARQLGIEPAELGEVPELMPGGSEES